MVKSMYAGVAGLKTHQNKMDVIGNNIANVNTYGYKKERASFSDTIYALRTASSDPTTLRGGVNPSQVGYGVQMSSVQSIVTTGGAAVTDNPTDVMITGNGYFLVGAYNADGATTSSEIEGTDGTVSLTSLYFTRVGIFNFDGHGDLVDGNSQYVYGFSTARGKQNLYEGVTGTEDNPTGWMYKSTTEYAGTDAQRYYVEPVTATDGTIIKYQVYKLHTDQAEGDDKTITFGDKTYYCSSANDMMQTINEDDYSWGAEYLYTLDQDSKFSEPKDYQVSQITGYVTSIKTGTEVSDESELHVIELPRTYSLDGYVDKDGNPLEATLYSENDSVEVPLYKLGADGKTVYKVWEDGTTDEGLVTPSTDKKQKTMVISGEEYWSRAVEMKMSAITIASDGTVSGVNEDNRLYNIGKICVADVPNPSALEAQGNNYYMAKANTGVIEAFVAGEGTTGALQAGSLEMSNVDLSTEFTDMITTQRGYQANSRIITVTDSMLEELVNMKRS